MLFWSEGLPQKRPSTIPTQTQHLHWWKSQFGHFPLADVIPAIVVAYRNMLTYGRANATVNRYLAVLSHTVTTAVREWQWCADNPVWKVSKVKEPRGRVRLLSNDEGVGVADAMIKAQNELRWGATVSLTSDSWEGYSRATQGDKA